MRLLHLTKLFAAVVLCVGAVAALATAVSSPAAARARGSSSTSVTSSVGSPGLYTVVVTVRTHASRRTVVDLQIGSVSRVVVMTAHTRRVTLHQSIRVRGHSVTVRAHASGLKPVLSVSVSKLGSPQPAVTPSVAPSGQSGTVGGVAGSNPSGGSSGGGGASGTTGGGTGGGTPAPATVLFDGSSLASWGSQSAAPSRNQEVPDPDGQGDTVIQLTADNSDVAPLTPTDNPRAQLVSNYALPTSQTIWASYELYLPTSFPVSDVLNHPTEWLEFDCPAYGQPFNGSPPLELGVNDINNAVYLTWQEDASYKSPNAILWKEPIVLGQWIRFTWEYTVAESGVSALYVNDHLVAQISQGALDSSNNVGPESARLMVYYSLGAFSQVTAYFKNFKIATTQAAAES